MHRLPPCDSIEIPVNFTPARIDIFTCVVSFVLGDKLSWKHFVEGQVEIESVAVPDPFTTKCKEETHKLIAVDLRPLKE